MNNMSKGAMAFFLGGSLVFGAGQAGAMPCFHAGKYKGGGYGAVSPGPGATYSVETEIMDATTGVSRYVWPGGGRAEFSFRAENGNLLIDGQEAGTVECGLATQRLVMNIDDFVLREEWSFLGNYLIRKGSKIDHGREIEYQELLIRE